MVEVPSPANAGGIEKTENRGRRGIAASLGTIGDAQGGRNDLWRMRLRAPQGVDSAPRRIQGGCELRAEPRCRHLRLRGRNRRKDDRSLDQRGRLSLLGRQLTTIRSLNALSGMPVPVSTPRIVASGGSTGRDGFGLGRCPNVISRMQSTPTEEISCEQLLGYAGWQRQL